VSSQVFNQAFIMIYKSSG